MKIQTIIVLLFGLLVVTSGRHVKSDHNNNALVFSLKGSPYTVSNVTDCSDCAAIDNSYWCDDRSLCLIDVDGNATISSLPLCKNGYCSGDSCRCETECLNSIWPCSGTVVGMLILMAGYGVILAYGAKLISDGSELLLEILDPGIIGGLLLPLLSAFPDAAIIVVSGAFSSQAMAQAQLSVGLGTLAGSTVMLLTIPYSASLLLARCDLRNGYAVDGVCTSRSLTKTGVTVDDDTPLNAKIMMLTSVSYLIVQGIAFAYLKDPDSGKHVEKWFALVGFIVCLVFLVLYCTYQVVSPKLQEKKMAEAKRKYMLNQTIHHFLHNLTKRRFPSASTAAAAAATSSNNNNNSESNAESGEQSPLLHSEHQHLPVDVKGIGLKWKAKAKAKVAEREEVTSIQVEEKKDEDDEEEENQGPVTPEERKKIALKAAVLLAIGSVMVSVFSDPMVDVITDFGNKLNIKLFYISFIVTPFCSNASELISSLIFASKKRKANSSLTFSALYGSATMNNTMCLGIFFALVFFRNLTWEFSAETVTILFVTLSVGIIGATRKTMKFFWAPTILCLYPLSLLLVYLLEQYAHWQ
ncbi:hypothetical protein PPL_01216 [Heterostelium album PN500]|uniref:Sodium/calcium exchanger membrane region domain-containing protein n=1 Tax=Heterostelium pallidum (strain ATCC 26659 / Pp 5 / PN500) TaxID=670386 RepID=D3AYF6_HETP5|nr:hypothetical protein PPL_01216 [Heterostelium album PN500]EFA85983.1 hypothetical protein PPL_01216 [Heterostelium album PN500]|eukprot:XP_020438089.1 hypothetical protein PPL_01216 [Heterostelium album PN500]